MLLNWFLELNNLDLGSVFPPDFMLLILDGNSEIGAHLRNNLYYLIRLRHFNNSREFIIRDFFPENIYFAACMRNLF